MVQYIFGFRPKPITSLTRIRFRLILFAVYCTYKGVGNIILYLSSSMIRFSSSESSISTYLSSSTLPTNQPTDSHSPPRSFLPSSPQKIPFRPVYRCRYMHAKGITTLCTALCTVRIHPERVPTFFHQKSHCPAFRALAVSPAHSPTPVLPTHVLPIRTSSYLINPYFFLNYC
jgi:hypothetical protein